MRESEIRDYLVNHIQIISKDFEVIKKEYKLQNIDGTNGAVDILARDSYNNYVIIEIKRSNQAARQALHEITKYARLLKSNMKVKESEIRIIILSTEWDELLTPFSEYKQKNTLFIEGYKLILKPDEKRVVGVEKIKPLPETAPRAILRQQHLFLYSKIETLRKNIHAVIHTIQKFKIVDFVIIQMSTKKDIMFPYGLVVVFQSLDESTYIKLIQSEFPSIMEDIELFKEENSDAEYSEYINYLEACVFGEVISKIRSDSYEVLYPEKLLASIAQGWEVDCLYRYGCFNLDERSDEWLIKQIAGVNGDNSLIYEDVLETQFKTKFIEFKSGLLHYLRFSSELCQLAEMICESIEAMEENVRIQVYYYNPDDIIWSLALLASDHSNEGLPMLYIYVDCLDGIHQYVYWGHMVYAGQAIDFNTLKLIYFSNHEFNYFIYKQMGDIASLNEDIMDGIGLHFAVDKIEFNASEVVRNTQILLDDSHKYSFEEFTYKEKKLLDCFMQLYKSYTNVL